MNKSKIVLIFSFLKINLVPIAIPNKVTKFRHRDVGPLRILILKFSLPQGLSLGMSVNLSIRE